ncbi:uncharacterized protein [Clinocottus analis]|uniref:uncharacterized protein n=1 Tax=Clinocottus analis TaxID=304258 RepID=UPI0035C25530
MSAVAPPAAGAHLQCSLCGHFSRSHVHLLTHLAATHPAHLDSVAVGRLGNILMYQNTARLFHCRDCFFTSRDFTKLYKHLISRHCEEQEEEEKEEGGKTREEEEEKTGKQQEEKTREDGERKMTREEEKTSKLYKHLISRHCEEEEGRKRREEEEEEKTREEGEENTREEGKGKMKMREEEKTSKLYKRFISRHCEEEEERKRREEEAQMKKGEEGEEQKKTWKESDALKRSSEEEQGRDEEASSSPQGDESVLMFDGSGYHCLICGWKTKLKALGVNHAVRKHDIPKAYACQAIRRDAAPTAQEDGGAGLSGEQLKEEMEATAKVVRFISNRFVCLLCGWKTKLKGFAISHVVRCHDVARPYGCRRCARCFFLPSRLQQHVRAAHRPGRYACPFCCFRSHFLGGFRRHCSRCSARGQGAGPEGGGAREEEEEEEEEKTERRGARKRRRTERVMEEED